MNNKDLLYKKLNALRLEVDSSIVDDIVSTVDDLFSQQNGAKPIVSGSLPPTEAEILTEAQKHYEDYGISYPESLVHMAKWALSFGGNDR